MLGTANGALVHEYVHPCTASIKSFAESLNECELWPLLLRQDAAPTGPPVARRVADDEARRVGARDRADSAAGHRWPVSGTRPPLAQSEGRMPGDRATGGVFLWLLSLHKQRKWPARPQGEWKLCSEGDKKKQGTGFRLSPE